MNLYNIPSLITIGDGNGGQAIVSIKEYLRTLISANGIATFMTHKVEMYGSADTGAIRVRIPRFLQVQNYSALGGNPTQRMEVSEVIVPVEETKMVKTEVEHFDLVRFQKSGEYQAEVLGSIAKSIVAYLNAVFYQTVFDCLKTNKQNTIQLDFEENATTVDGFNNLKLKAYQYVQFINKSKKIFTNLNYSLETTDITTVLNSQGATNLVYGFTSGSASDKAIDIQVKGFNVVPKSFGGLTYLTDDMVINNSLAAGLSFNGDVDFDFAGLTAISVYVGSVAMPYLVQSLKVVDNPDTLNPIIGSKLLYGVKVVLPQFVWGAVKDNSAFTYDWSNVKLGLIPNATTNPTKIKVVVSPNTITPDEIGNFTVKSSNEGVATVSYDAGVITVTKVAAGTTDISIETSTSTAIKPAVRTFTFTD